jgi:transglutaminase-like putative cysteine protease
MIRKTSLIALAASLWLGANAQIATPTVEADFAGRKSSVADPGYFKIFNRTLTPEQEQALKVLYAYMPLPDMADNSGDFFLENVDYALKARKEMPWGSKVPDREFRHFVLPVRINNEYLDGHRKVFYEELKDRVKNMSMADAILEINHWCHEKATYQPSDSRTHSPLATVYTAIGRCGEESTFTVAALRAMGIPARQIYTPRWAHTDDNHAWVEAWADGRWYFLGACEPEPVLNLGWFNAPASRGMMMNTRVAGNYDGPEEVLSRPAGYTDINVTSNYAPVDTINVTVLDASGKVVPNAKVSFRLYNYAEFYPIATKTADSNGKTSLSTGLGDLVIWASDGNGFGFTKGSVGKQKDITVVIDKNSATTGAFNLDIIPPAPSNKPVTVTPEQAAENERRKVYEDSLRGAYTATFMTPAQSAALAKELGVDEARLTSIMTDARGNHAVIKQFLAGTPAADRDRAMNLLEAISMKDRSDVVLPVLLDQMITPAGTGSMYVDYVLCPRVDNEALSLFRSYFTKTLGAKKLAAYKANPASLIKDVTEQITVLPDWYPGNVRMSPEAVHKSKKTNTASRDIYFVTLARTAGIPARIDPVTGKTQWAAADEVWQDVDFGAKTDIQPTSKPGNLKLDFTKTGRIDDPRYYTQFSISKIVDGEPQLMGYPEDGTWKSIFANGAEIDPGQYMIVTGQRMADGGVLARADFINIAPGENVTDSLILRQDDKGVQVIGNFNSENLYTDLATGTEKSVLSTTGRGYYIIGVLTPNHEPTNHALRDIAALNPEFEKWGRSMILLFKDKQDAERFDPKQLPALPSTASFGIDNDSKIASEIIANLKLPESERPIFIIADTFNRIVFVSQGYTIGLGEQLVDTIHQLKE